MARVVARLVQGFAIQGMGLLPRRGSFRAKRIDPATFEKTGYLCLYRKGVVLQLHITPETLPTGNGHDILRGMKGPDGKTEMKKVVHLLRGRQRDASRSVYAADGMGYNLAPLCYLAPSKNYAVEFDGKLFDGKTGDTRLWVDTNGAYLDPDGPWPECTDPDLLAIYAEYFAVSPHHHSIRPYRKKSTSDEPAGELAPQPTSTTDSDSVSEQTVCKFNPLPDTDLHPFEALSIRGRLRSQRVLK